MSDPTRPVDAARTAFRDAFGGDPTVVGTAPGRVNLVGGHTDYNEGFVLPAAIDRRTAVAGRTCEDRTLAVHVAALDDRHEASLEGLEPGDWPRWFDYVAGVVDALDVPAGEGSDPSNRGFELAVAGDVPLGAGLSSSASLELAVAAAVRELAGLAFDDRELAVRCWEAETGFVGLDCGIMDQYAAALGEVDAALFLDCRMREHETVQMPTDARLVVVDTDVEHELAASAYNDRVAECATAVDRFDDLLDRDVSALRDVSATEFEAHADALSRPARDRAEHVVRENERVREAAARLREGELNRCGDLLYASHGSLRDLYEVSCDELDAVVGIARETGGVHGARMTGGGFGGSVVCLVAPDAVARLVAAVEREYPDRTGVEPGVYPCAVGRGVDIHRR